MANVLIIDDDSSIRELLGRYLRTEGHEVVTASNGAAGIEASRSDRPDIALCDLRMPGIDGLEVLAHLTREAPEMPVIVVSGTGELADAIQSLKRGAWDYVTKPIEDLDMLGHAVGKALERARLIAENRKYRERLEQANARLERTLRQLESDEESGREIQFTLLPESPRRFDGYECSRYLAPSAFLSGDFIDYFPIGEDRFGFYIADVSGHGVASAVITVLLKTQVARHLDAFVHHGDPTIGDPAALLAALNREVLAGRHGKYLTMFYGVVEPRTGRLQFANAGQFPFPYLFDGMQVTQIGGRSRPIGLFDDASYANRSMAIADTFALRLFSDGVLEVLPEPDLDTRKRRLGELSGDALQGAEQLARRIGLDRAAERPDDAAVLSVRKVGADG